MPLNGQVGIKTGIKLQKPKPTPKPTVTKHPMRDYGFTQTHYGSTYDKKQQAFLKKLQQMNKTPWKNISKPSIPKSPTH